MGYKIIEPWFVYDFQYNLDFNYFETEQEARRYLVSEQMYCRENGIACGLIYGRIVDRITEDSDLD